ncbi:alcohol dehydrogenase catalytic domain-containing protein [Nonomuraea sp. NEAU-A123]|uniref:alcohol dehydrogenase catalytic domain-containing protein n=1 Tax=Nonomuraea sp. NEAU-A123 TaxID=2839649 RepID=UPI001BE41D3F|nr:alcohol dehydrogenase catalytic domain-containing protein [Nonomuraea sp. NEAU-A123]MBT2231752.1 alcohol dehydrogenase catalytic domain-containing protein [Nonomuraea sp. NEAU-A123]
MFAVQFDRFGPPDVLTVGLYPEPHAGPDEVRIIVKTAGVSPVDVALRAGLSPSGERIPLPHVPGVDAAGVIDEVGTDVTGFAVGDEVFGTVDVSRLGGASAEFAMTEAAEAHASAARGPRQGKITLTAYGAW